MKITMNVSAGRQTSFAQPESQHLRQCLKSAVVAGFFTLSLGCAQVQAVSEPQGYADHEEAKAFTDTLVEEGFDRQYVEELFAQAKRQDSILEAIARPAERRLTWGEYRKIFLGEKRINQGVDFWNKHRDTLNRASETFGVEPEIIVAIIGVETRYGGYAGNYKVLDALATLSFDYPPRSRFFSGQLKELLYLVEEEKLDINSLKGSYAGAMGYGQFIPSSYRDFAVDFDGDGQRDLLNNPVDAIGSVANYFKQHGWQQGERVALPAKTTKALEDDAFSSKLKPVKDLEQWQSEGIEPESWPEDVQKDRVATALRLQIDDQNEHWLGLKNFYVITRYNHSSLYAMAVYQLSQEIKARYQQVADAGAGD